jgi:transposase
VRTAYKFRMYPTKQQIAILDMTLETCRHLWNNALADRKNTWEQEHKNTSYEDQAAILTSEKQNNPTSKGSLLKQSRMYLDGSRKPLITSSQESGNMPKRKGILDSRLLVDITRSHTRNPVSRGMVHDLLSPRSQAH